MKPKYSTGYLTPQAGTKKKNTSKLRRTESQEDIPITKDLSDSFFENLMKCPIKRHLVLNLINSEKHNIEEYKRNREKEKKKKEGSTTPLSKIKQHYQCESPTALLRRRALEQQNRQNACQDQEQSDYNSRSTSRQSTVSSPVSSSPSPISFDKLLDGVIAYVEIKSKDQDRSSGAKALMNSMGATIRDKFTKDVTHVVFKDGSFTTYQKAKLMKVHLVSVLWIEAVRSRNMRVPEKKFPALGTEAYDNNVSTICSQLQKDYEEIIREELRLSLATGTPLPSTQTLINRRRTLMTPIASSNRFSQEFPSSQDKEVEKILHPSRKTYNFLSRPSPIAETPSSDLLTDDESDLGPFINGAMVKRHSDPTNKNSNALRQLENSDMDLTFPRNPTNLIQDSEHIVETDSGKENTISDTSSHSIYHKKTPKVKNTSERNLMPKDDKVSNTLNESIYRRKTRQLNNDESVSNKSKNDLGDSMLGTKADKSSSTNMSALDLSDKPSGIQILSKNVCGTNNIIESTNALSLVLNNASSTISKVTNDKSASTNMSSLQISLIKEKSSTDAAGVSASTNMSALLISELSKDKPKISLDKDSFSTENSALLDPNIAEELLQLLESPRKDENVTRRRQKQEVEERTYNTRRKTMLPSETSLSGTGSSPPKRVRINSGTSKQKDSDEDKNKGNRGKYTNKKKLSKKKEIIVQLTRSLDDVHITPNNQNDKMGSRQDRKAVSEKKPRKNMTKQDKRNLKSSDSQDTSDTSGSDKKLNRTRKLYNPDDSIKETPVNDEMERNCKRKEVKNRRSNEGVVLNPNIIRVSPNTILTAKAKEFLDQNNINVKDVLNIDLTESENETDLNLKPKKLRNKVNKNKKQVSISSEDDEQKHLAAEFIDKKTTTENTDKNKNVIDRRRSKRLSQYPRKRWNLNGSTSSSDEKDIVPVTPVTNRRSTMEFQSKSQMSSTKKLKIDKNKRPSIVCTKFHKEDIQLFHQIVKKLGRFVIEDEVSTKTTHLVAGEPKRTINMLRAMAMGCWILKHEWLLRSLEEGKWLPEEDYEETDFSPAVQRCRLQRQAFGPNYSMDVFQDCGQIYIARGTIPRCSDLRELVTLCKGNVVNSSRNAAVVVGEFVRYEGIKCVKEAWVLDSITFNRRMPFKKYFIDSDNSSQIV